tara:strand:+ start:3365 stop:4072 length:708 start_codon:yes stop_codon:yes gene_type:complete
MSYKLLTVSGNPKVVKGDKVSDYLTAIMHLRPENTRICPFQDIAGCKVACLNTAGRGGIIKKGETTNRIQEARKRKTKLYLEDRDSFMTYLIADIERFVRYCAKKDKLPAIRLNGTSDIQWETIKIEGKHIFDMFPDVQFYDYTKIPTRKIEGIDNYHLTWSYSEANNKYAEYINAIKYNIAVVFNGEKPIYYKGREVIDGDETDLRFLDKPNKIIALKAKGKAKHDMTGFVIHV